jgi:hypothetical protein|tara:strand:+ start:940 stop:1119 length:180 start_codon:yes stop_codon:yes gene_type:complete
MVFTSEELIELVDELRARGVTYFKVEGAEITMEALPGSDEVEVEHTPGEDADDVLYYSS